MQCVITPANLLSERSLQCPRHALSQRRQPPACAQKPTTRNASCPISPWPRSWGTPSCACPAHGSGGGVGRRWVSLSLLWELLAGPSGVPSGLKSLLKTMRPRLCFDKGNKRSSFKAVTERHSPKKYCPKKSASRCRNNPLTPTPALARGTMEARKTHKTTFQFSHSVVFPFLVRFFVSFCVKGLES